MMKKEMWKVANFTLHPQDTLLSQWRSLGVEVDPVPRAPHVSDDLYEDEVRAEVEKRIRKIAEEGFEGVLLGGLTNVMCYAWFYAQKYGLKAFVAKVPRERDESGRFVFRLVGWAMLYSIDELEKLWREGENG